MSSKHSFQLVLRHSEVEKPTKDILVSWSGGTSGRAALGFALCLMHRDGDKDLVR